MTVDEERERTVKKHFKPLGLNGQRSKPRRIRPDRVEKKHATRRVRKTLLDQSTASAEVHRASVRETNLDQNPIACRKHRRQWVNARRTGKFQGRVENNPLEADRDFRTCAEQVERKMELRRSGLSIAANAAKLSVDGHEQVEQHRCE